MGTDRELQVKGRMKDVLESQPRPIEQRLPLDPLLRGAGGVGCVLQRDEVIEVAVRVAIDLRHLLVSPVLPHQETFATGSPVLWICLAVAKIGLYPVMALTFLLRSKNWLVVRLKVSATHTVASGSRVW